MKLSEVFADLINEVVEAKLECLNLPRRKSREDADMRRRRIIAYNRVGWLDHALREGMAEYMRLEARKRWK